MVDQPRVLSTLPSVELMRAGTWDLSTGPVTFTPDDLRAAVTALECPAVRRPVLKLGHVDPRFDGEPAVGWVANLASDGMTLSGDYVGVPSWLVDVMASAYPDRSIEGQYGYTCQLGHEHPFVLTGVALLGVTAPGVGTLESLQDVARLYGVAASAPDADGVVKLDVSTTAHAAEGSLKVVSTEDIRRAFYASGPDGSVWIQEIHVDPPQLIVCDDATNTFARVSYSVSGDGEVAFSDPIPVVVRYEDTNPADEQVAAGAAHAIVVFASAGESRKDLPASEPEETPQGKETAVAAEILAGGLRERLGLASDADLDDAGLLAALDEALSERAEADTVAAAAPEPTTLPEGRMVVSKNVWEEMVISAKAGAEARAIQLRQERDGAISAAVAAGKVAPARRDHWAAAWDKDPEGTAADLASLPENRLPVAASGYAGHDDEAAESDAVFDSLFGKEV